MSLTEQQKQAIGAKLAERLNNSHDTGRPETDAPWVLPWVDAADFDCAEIVEFVAQCL